MIVTSLIVSFLVNLACGSALDSILVDQQALSREIYAEYTSTVALINTWAKNAELKARAPIVYSSVMASANSLEQAREMMNILSTDDQVNDYEISITQLSQAFEIVSLVVQDFSNLFNRLQNAAKIEYAADIEQVSGVWRTVWRRFAVRCSVFGAKLDRIKSEHVAQMLVEPTLRNQRTTIEPEDTATTTGPTMDIPSV